LQTTILVAKRRFGAVICLAVRAVPERFQDIFGPPKEAEAKEFLDRFFRMSWT